jgi:hypothetical protein
VDAERDSEEHQPARAIGRLSQKNVANITIQSISPHVDYLP